MVAEGVVSLGAVVDVFGVGVGVGVLEKLGTGSERTIVNVDGGGSATWSAGWRIVGWI